MEKLSNSKPKKHYRSEEISN